MTAPVCVKCKIRMRCKKTGVDVELMATTDGYQIWMGDHFQCEGCGCEVVTGFGQKPVAEHFQRDRYASFLPGVLLRFWASLKERQEGGGGSWTAR